MSEHRCPTLYRTQVAVSKGFTSITGYEREDCVAAGGCTFHLPEAKFVEVSTYNCCDATVLLIGGPRLRSSAELTSFVREVGCGMNFLLNGVPSGMINEESLVHGARVHVELRAPTTLRAASLGFFIAPFSSRSRRLHGTLSPSRLW